MAYRISIGQFLKEQGLIGDAQLLSALAFQSKSGGRLDEALLQLRLVGEDELLSALAEQSSVPPVKIGNLNVPANVLGLVPEKLMRRRYVFPLAVWTKVQPRRLVVAMSDPSDLRLRDEVAFSAGMQLEVVLALGRDVAQAIARHLGDSVSPVSKRPGSTS